MIFDFGETEYDLHMRKKNWTRVKVRNYGELVLAVEYIYEKCEGSNLMMINPTLRVTDFEADNSGIVWAILHVEYEVGFR